MLTVERVKELFSYDGTGLIWLIDRPNAPRGSRAGYVSGPKNGKRYRLVTVDNKLHGEHRLIWMLQTGEIPIQVDHQDGNGLNNRFENLRSVTRVENQHNLRKRKDNTSGVTGVCWHKTRKQWVVRISTDRKVKCVGYFADFEAAVAARRKALVDCSYHPNHGTERPL